MTATDPATDAATGPPTGPSGRPFLDLPERTAKPREDGITSLLDPGVPTGVFEDAIASASDYVDYVKFGWGTGLLTKDLPRKIEIARRHDVEVYLGGSFFEKSLHQGKLPQFRDYVRDLDLRVVEISNGSLDIPNEVKAGCISEFASEFTVFSEVGFKDPERSKELHPAKWIEFIRADLEAGATKVITEARESGKSGICRENGELRFGLIAEILDSGLDEKQIVFEAPSKALQVYFIDRIGANVNLGNIAFGDVIGLESLRVGLRFDTLLRFEEK